MDTPFQSDEDKRKDTSLPGREEEIIVNTDLQQHTTNLTQGQILDGIADAQPIEPTVLDDADQSGSPQNPEITEKTFKEGLSDNSNTDKAMP